MDQVLAVSRTFKPAGANTGLVQVRGKVATTDNTATVVYAFGPVLEGECIKINASVLGFQDDLSDASSADIECVATRATAGNVTVKGTAGNRIVESDATTNFTVTANTTDQTVEVKVVGVTGQNWSWELFATYFKTK